VGEHINIQKGERFILRNCYRPLLIYKHYGQIYYIDILPALKREAFSSILRNISLDSEYIDDDMSSTAVVGFCVTGLNSQKSPTRFNFDEDNNMNISIDSNTSNEKEINNGLNAQEIVDKCSK